MTAVKFLSFLVVVVSSFYIGGAKWILPIWLGSVKEDTLELSILCTIYLPLVLGLIPAWTFLMAKSDISLLGKVTFIGGIVNVLVSIFLVKSSDLGIYATILPFIMLLIVQNLAVVPLILKKHGVKIIPIYKIVFFSLVSTVVLSSMVYYIFTFFYPVKTASLLLTYLAITCFLLLVTYFILMLKYQTINVKLLLYYLKKTI
jgi:membrane protein EpsK